MHEDIEDLSAAYGHESDNDSENDARTGNSPDPELRILALDELENPPPSP